MIGLIDLDLQLSNGLTLHPPNLEVMKLATYYKIEEQKFCRLIDLNETELAGYSKIYICSEIYNMTSIPKHFLSAPSIVLCGSGLTNEEYIPFTNELIDFTLPRPAIYKEYLKQKYQDGVKAELISHLLDDSYYRYKARNNKLPLPPIQRNKRLWVYDRDFFQEGWQEWVQEAIDRKVSGVWTIHPIRCTKVSDYQNVRTIPKIARQNLILFDIPIPLSEIPHLFKEYKNFFLEDIVPTSNVYIPIGGTYPTSFMYYKDLIYKLNLLYSFWARSIPIKLKYLPPKIGVNCSISNLLVAIEMWSNSNNKKWSIDDKLQSKKNYYKSAKEEQQLLLKFHKNAEDLFKQSYEDLSSRRIWRI